MMCKRTTNGTIDEPTIASNQSFTSLGRRPPAPAPARRLRVPVAREWREMRDLISIRAGIGLGPVASRPGATPMGWFYWALVRLNALVLRRGRLRCRMPFCPLRYRSRRLRRWPLERPVVALARFSEAQRQDSTESDEGQQDQDQDGLRVIAHVAS